jgi:hypothetical protein
MNGASDYARTRWRLKIQGLETEIKGRKRGCEATHSYASSKGLSAIFKEVVEKRQFVCVALYNQSVFSIFLQFDRTYQIGVKFQAQEEEKAT